MEKYLPDYEIIEWNEIDYEISKYLYTDFMYKHGEFSFVSDVVRFDVLNTYGGIYLDIDVILCDNLDALLNNKAFCCIDSPNPEHFASAIIGSESNSTFVNHCLKIFENILCEGMTLHHHQIDNWVEVMKYVLLNEGVKLTNELQRLDLCTVYPYPYFTVTAKTSDTILGVHLNIHNWNRGKNYIHYVAVDNYNKDINSLNNLTILPTIERVKSLIPSYKLYFLPATTYMLHFIHPKMNLQTVVRKLGLTDYTITKLEDNKIYI